jgi:hypothetical protein
MAKPTRAWWNTSDQKLNLTTLAFQRIDDVIHAIGLPEDQLCTYCWSGKDYAETGDCYHCPCESEGGECPCKSKKG